MDDWKSKLGAAFGVNPEEGAARAQAADEAAKAAQPTDALSVQGKKQVNILLDRKQRHGKQVTLITDLLCDDDALDTLARQLKKHCGAGGSARCGEILIQGDFRQKALNFLLAKGFKARII